jgi:hypothetical protein
MTDQPGLQSLYRTGSSGTANLAEGFTTGLTAAAFTARFTTRLLDRFTGRVRRAAPRVVLVARIVPLSPTSSKFASRELRLPSVSITLGAFAADRAPSGSNFVPAACNFGKKKHAT